MHCGDAHSIVKCENCRFCNKCQMEDALIYRLSKKVKFKEIIVDSDSIELMECQCCTCNVCNEYFYMQCGYLHKIKFCPYCGSKIEVKEV